MDTNKYYKLIEITDREDADKSQSKELYIQRINCLATNMHLDKKERVCIEFVQSADGKPILRHLHTSRLECVEETEKGIILHTHYSRYVFEEAAAPKETYLNAADLVELFLTNEGKKFVKGFYYDQEKKPHKLHIDLHAGTFTDTALIYDAEAPAREVYCRYYIVPDNTIEFYDTIYRQQDYSREMVIHNVGEKPLAIKFDRSENVVVLAPCATKQLTPEM